jgi:uncharacterized protein
MAYDFGSLIFTPAVKALQEKHGSRKQYERREFYGPSGDPIGEDEAQFIGERDSFYMASVGEGGWPYVQHRGGTRGFLKVIDGRTLAFADLRGNKQYITTGNLTKDARVAILLMDYPRRTRLKVLGRVEIFEGDAAKPWIAKLDEVGDGIIERVFVIHAEATDWNCPQHITPRYTEEEIRGALQPLQSKLESLEKENAALKRQLQAAQSTAEKQHV